MKVGIKVHTMEEGIRRNWKKMEVSVGMATNGKN